MSERTVNRFIRKQPWKHGAGLGPTGRKLCCCGCGREVGPKRSSSHSKECVDWWKSHSDMNHICWKVEKRDKGLCATCGQNAIALKQQYEEALHKAIGKPWSWSHHGAEYDPRCAEIVRLRREAGWPGLERRWWEADHIIPVSEGGGGCDFTGYRTLCLPCHKQETKALAARLAAKRRAAKLVA